MTLHIRDAQIAGVFSLAHYFPDRPQDEVIRDNLLDSIQGVIESGTPLVVVEGNDGSGKTILMAQLCRRFPLASFPIFLNPLDRASSDPALVRLDLAHQIAWLLNEPSSAEEPAELNFLIHKLGKHRRQKSTPILFVLDGLDEHVRESQEILDSLPINTPGFHVVIAGDAALIPERVRRVPTRHLLVPGFTVAESVQFFGGRVLPEDAEELHRVWKGVPGRLASVKRLIENGITVESLLNDPTAAAPELFALEWSTAGALTSDEELSIALLAFENRPRSVVELAALSSMDTGRVQELVSRATFLTVGEDGLIRFTSDAMSRFAARELEKYREEVEDRIVSRFLEEPDADTALSLLPQYLQQTGRLGQLLEYMTAERFRATRRLTGVAAPLKQRAEMVQAAAYTLGRDEHLLRTSIQRSTILEYEFSAPGRRQVEAYVAFGEFDRALAVAHSAELLEDRLQLLGVIGRGKKKLGIPTEPEIEEELGRLVDRIATEDLGNRAVDVAVDLLPAFPQLAVSLLEKVFGPAPGGGALDRALAIVSLASLRQAEPSATQQLEALHGKIEDPQLRRFVAHTRLVFGDMAAEQLLSELPSIGSVAEQLSMLKSWARIQRGHVGTGQVLSAALDLLVKANDYVPTATDLRELATPLQYLEDAALLEQLVARVDRLLSGTQDIGPTGDIIRTQLLLALAERRIDDRRATERFVDIYFRVMKITAAYDRCIALAWLLKTLPQVDADGALDRIEGISEVVVPEVLTLFADLLQTSADHDVLARPILQPLAKTQPQLAMQLVESLNTEARRDSAYLDIVISAADARPTLIQPDIIRTLLSRIEDYRTRDVATAILLEHLSGDVESVSALPHLGTLCAELARSVRSPSERCIAFGRAAICLPAERSGEAESLLNDLTNTLTALPEDHEQVEVAYECATILREHYLRQATQCLEFAEKRAQTLTFADDVQAEAYDACLQLGVRAFAGMVATNCASDADRQSVLDLIGRVVDPVRRLRLLADLSCRLVAAGRRDDALRIHEEQMSHLLQTLEHDSDPYCSGVVAMAPVLAALRPFVAKEMVGRLPSTRRDEALNNALRFVITKAPPGDPCDDRAEGYDISYADAEDALAILDQMDLDQDIYWGVDALALSGKSKFNGAQKAELAGRLEELIEKKLPAPRGIRHQGFVVLGRAQLHRLRGNVSWPALITEAEGIPNVADRAYVLTALTELMPPKESERKDKIFEQLQAMIAQLPSAYERAQHYLYVAWFTVEYNRPVSKRFVRLGFQACGGGSSRELGHARSHLIDIAHRLDPLFANELAKSMEVGAADKVLASVKERLTVLGMRTDIANCRFTTEAATSKEALPAAAWMLLGSLNSTRVQPMGMNEFRDVLLSAGSMPLRQSFPVYALAIQNAIEKMFKQPKSREAGSPLLSGVSKAAEFASSLYDAIAAVTSGIGESRIVIVPSGEREAGLALIDEWLESVTPRRPVVMDPYIGPGELQILKAVLRVNRECRVCLITSWKHLRQLQIGTHFEDSFRTAWSSMSDQEAPPTDVMVVGTEGDGAPIVHDRWWLCEAGGLSIGTSFKDLGRGKDSEITKLTQAEAAQMLEQLEPILRRERRTHNGVKVLYTVFSL